jgi:hypothetical protein
MTGWRCWGLFDPITLLMGEDDDVDVNDDDNDNDGFLILVDFEGRWARGIVIGHVPLCMELCRAHDLKGEFKFGFLVMWNLLKQI